MELFKICPTCNTKNDIGCFICDMCMADISSVSQDNKTIAVTSNIKKTIKLINEDVVLEIEDGDIVGREYIGKEDLNNISSISRRHALFSYDKKNWYIEDLKSTNGIYINEIKIQINSKIQIKHNDKISLSLKFSAIINIVE